MYFPLFIFLSFFHSTRGLLFIQWYVSSVSKDIADFYLHIRDGSNKILLEKILAYDTRFANVSSDELTTIDFQQNVDLCVLARNSDYTISSIEDNQCTRVPSNFNAIMKKYNRRPNSIFKIYEMDKMHLGRNAIVHQQTSGVERKIGFNNLLIFGIAVTVTKLMNFL